MPIGPNNHDVTLPDGVTTNNPFRVLTHPDGSELLDAAVARGRLSARGVDKVLRLAWTIADLAGDSRPTRQQLHTALAMRRGEEVAL